MPDLVQKHSWARQTNWPPPQTKIRISRGVFTLFNSGAPSVYADIDRVKAEKVGLTPTDVFSTLQVYLGSQYVNDFNLLGRTFEVVVQADGDFRRDHDDISRLKVRNSSGEMVPIGTVAQMRRQHDSLSSTAL